MSEEIDNFATSVANNIKDESNRFGSLVITLMIVSIIVSILRLMQSCNFFGKSIEQRIKNPGPIDRALLKRTIRQKLNKDQLHLSGELYKQILSKTPDLSSQQINQMMEEVKEMKEGK